MVYVIKERDRIIIPRETWIQAAFELVVMIVGGVILFFGIRFAWHYFYPTTPQSFVPVRTRLYAQDREVLKVDSSRFTDTVIIPELGISLAVPPGTGVHYDRMSRMGQISTTAGDGIMITAYTSDELDLQMWYLRNFGPETTIFEQVTTSAAFGVIARLPENEFPTAAVIRLDPATLVLLRPQTLSVDHVFFGSRERIGVFLNGIRR